MNVYLGVTTRREHLENVSTAAAISYLPEPCVDDRVRFDPWDRGSSDTGTIMSLPEEGRATIEWDNGKTSEQSICYLRRIL